MRRKDEKTKNDVRPVFRRKLDEIKMRVERDRNERLAERQRRIEAGEPVDDEDEEAENGQWITWTKPIRTFFSP